MDARYVSDVNRGVTIAAPGEFAPLRIGPLVVDPPVVLAPMAGITNAPFRVAVDVSNRPFLVYRVQLANDRVGNFDVSLVEDFLYAFAQNAGLDLHVELCYGMSPHHGVEAIFKGLARALRVAVEIDLRALGAVPSVKDAL